MRGRETECHVDTKARYDSVHINQEAGDGKNTRTHTGDKVLIDTLTRAIMSHSKKRESGAQAGTSTWPPSISHTCTQQQQLRESSPGQPGRALMSPTRTTAGALLLASGLSAYGAVVAMSQVSDICSLIAARADAQPSVEHTVAFSATSA